MKKFLVCLSWLTFSSFLLSFPLLSTRCIAQQTNPGTTTLPKLPDLNPMLNDVRLDHKITLEAIGIPLPELLKKIGGANLSLFTAKNCEAQKIQLRVRGKSLRSVMNALAKLLPGTWAENSEKNGYSLRMSPTYERKREKWWTLYQEEREQALKRMKETILRDLQRKDKITSEDGSPLKDREFAQEVSGVDELCHALPAELLDKIAGNIDQRPFFASGAIRFGGDRDGAGDLSVPLASLPDQVKKTALTLCKPGSEPTDLHIANGGFTLAFGFYNAEGKAVGGGGRSVRGDAFNPVFLSTNQIGLYQALIQAGRSPKTVPPNWQKLLDYQRSTFWSEQKQPWPPRLNPAQKEDRADVLTRLSKTTDLEFIADYYSQDTIHRLTPEKPSKTARPPEVELNRLTLENDSSWRKSGNFYLVRNNRWCRDDWLEVPEELLARFYDPVKLDPQGRFVSVSSGDTGEAGRKNFQKTLDQESEIVLTINLWQLMNGFRFGTPPALKSGLSSQELAAHLRMQEEGNPGRTISEQDKEWVLNFATHPNVFSAQMILDDLYGLLFYGSLDKNQRNAILEGTLKSSTMTSQQLEAASVLLPSLGDTRRNSNRPVLLKIVPRYQRTADDYRNTSTKLLFTPVSTD